jgi:hypothetical protein
MLHFKARAAVHRGPSGRAGEGSAARAVGRLPMQGRAAMPAGDVQGLRLGGVVVEVFDRGSVSMECTAIMAVPPPPTGGREQGAASGYRWRLPSAGLLVDQAMLAGTRARGGGQAIGGEGRRRARPGGELADAPQDLACVAVSATLHRWPTIAVQWSSPGDGSPPRGASPRSVRDPSRSDPWRTPKSRSPA